MSRLYYCNATVLEYETEEWNLEKSEVETMTLFSPKEGFWKHIKFSQDDINLKGGFSACHHKCKEQ